MKHTTYKGIVMKITDLHLVILLDNGRYKNVPKNAIKEIPLLGQSITYLEKASSLRWVPYISVAALIFLSFISYSIFQSVKPSYLLVMDINPSLEMEVSEKGEVIDLRALNEDGEKIVSSIEDYDQNVLHVIDLIVKDAKQKGYLAKNPMISTSLISLEDNDITLPVKKINDALTSYVQGEHVRVEVKEAALVEYEEAKKLKLSVNYYQQYQDLVEKGLVEDLNDIKGKTIVELKSMASQPDKEIEDGDDKEAQLIPNDNIGQHKNTKQEEAKSKGAIKEPKKEQVPNNQAKGYEDSNTSEKSRNQIPKEAESNEKAPTKIDNDGNKQKSINEQENKEMKKEPPKIDNPQKEDPKPPKVEERVEEEQKIKQPPIVKESEEPEPEENKNQRSERNQENPSNVKEDEKGKSSERE